MFLPPNMAAMQTLLYTGSSKCPSLSWNGHKWQLSNPHTKPQILTSIRPIFTVRLSDAISYNTLPTRKKFQDFKTCFKACRQSCPEKCRKRVVRRLHSTKSYRVKSVFRQPQMFAQSPINLRPQFLSPNLIQTRPALVIQYSNWPSIKHARPSLRFISPSGWIWFLDFSGLQEYLLVSRD